MRTELACLYHCAVPFLSHAAVNLSWYDSTLCNLFYVYNLSCLFNCVLFVLRLLVIMNITIIFIVCIICITFISYYEYYNL